MVLALALLLGDGSCDLARKKQVELLTEVEPWLARHRTECTLCADGSSCREGFQRRNGARLAFESWRHGHAMGCQVCESDRCPEAEQQSAVLLAEAKVRHKTRCAKCPFDPAACEGWRTAADEAKGKLDLWKRDHGGGCDKCMPSCPDWQRRVKDHLARAEEAHARHADRCSDCKAGACDRAAQMRLDVHQQRMTQWRSHVESCPCGRRR